MISAQDRLLRTSTRVAWPGDSLESQHMDRKKQLLNENWRYSAILESIPPGAIFLRHLQDQTLDLARRLRSSDAVAAAAVLLCNQSPVPGQQRLRRDDRAQLD